MPVGSVSSDIVVRLSTSSEQKKVFLLKKHVKTVLLTRFCSTVLKTTTSNGKRSITQEGDHCNRKKYAEL
jgi:hypothetical protein